MQILILTLLKILILHGEIVHETKKNDVFTKLRNKQILKQNEIGTRRTNNTTYIEIVYVS